MINIDFNVLFEYLSYIKTGSLSQFNSYLSSMCYNKDLENYEKANIRRMFSRLGHIEFDYNENKFSVCSPTVCMIPNTNKGILSGRRTKNLLNDIKKFYEISETNNYDAPKCLVINVSDINYFKMNLPHLRISQDFTKNLLKLLPSLDDIENNLIKLDYSPISDSFPTRLYDLNSHKFLNYNSKIFYKDGLYEIKYYSNRQYFIYKNKQWYQIEKEYGKFLLEKKQNLFKYSENKLKLKNYMRLPELMDRCMTMRSGQNPQNLNGDLIYDNIDITTAKKVSNLLDQKLEV